MCAGAQLLLVPGSNRSLPDRIVPGGGRLIEIQLLVLYKRDIDFLWGNARKVYLRIPLSVRVVSGFAPQNSDQEVQHEKA